MMRALPKAFGIRVKQIGDDRRRAEGMRSHG